ncbi:MAG TPA: hypothetical protein VF506_03210 [Streptosporangiaceae bacterium]
MTSVLAARPVRRSLVEGVQRPRLEWLPVADDWSEGDYAVALAIEAQLVLDEWQRYVLKHALARRDGKWAAFEVGLIVSRQNGKGAVIEALELAALFLFDEVRLILHSAHKFDTAADAFRRILGLIEGNPDFAREVKKVVRSHGSESIELRNGKRLRFIARSAGAGRGFAADLVILDEAFNISEDAMASMLPTMSTRPNPQVWYTSTAGMPTSVQLGRIRDRGLRGDDPSLAFFEWSVDPENYDPSNPADWARANPGLGIRITAEYVDLERAALTEDDFARERLGIGVYPTDLANAWLVIPRDTWLGLEDERSAAQDPVAFAAEVNHVASHGAAYRPVASICAAGFRRDGRVHVERIEHRSGMEWVVPRLAELRRAHRPCGTVIDPTSHAGALIEDAEKSGVEVVKPFTARDAAQACGQFLNLAANNGLAHLGQDDLNRALAGAMKRDLSDAWAWDRSSPAADIGPLVGVTLAAWALNKFGRRKHPPYNMLRSIG